MVTDNLILKVENISKQYRLGVIGTGTISHDLNRFFAKVQGKEDPFLKVGETNTRDVKGNSNYVWALKNINFDVKRGEVLGIIGKNGAGKSTLLKILSKVTGPTKGYIKSMGRISSLLEVGTGFHPEMTGKENIFLNGAILGMSKKEIRSKLEQIIAFSGCERYIDTPVKRYSSGMKVRLAFAVAAFLEPDILVIDEVLAVGDAEFQKKAIGKMQDISNSEGRTVLFVSHDMAAIQNLCQKVIVLKDGEVHYEGPVAEGIEFYLHDNYSNNDIHSLKERADRKGTGEFKFTDIVLNEGRPILLKSAIQASISFAANATFKNVNIALTICKNYEEKLMTIDNYYQGEEVQINTATGEIVVQLPKLHLLSGIYSINLWASYNGVVLDYIHSAVHFTIENEDIYGTGKVLNPKKQGILYPDKCSWNVIN